MKLWMRASLIVAFLLTGGDRSFGQAAVETTQLTATADLVLRNGTIVTVDEALGEVQAIAIRGDRILDVGSNEQIAAFIGESTSVVDLHGKLAIPGFIEGHGHFISLGHAKMNLDLMTVRNWDEVIQMVAAAVSKARIQSFISVSFTSSRFGRILRPSQCTVHGEQVRHSVRCGVRNLASV